MPRPSHRAAGAQAALTGALCSGQMALMLINALTLSLTQLGDRRIIGIFVKSMLITLVLFVGIGAGVLASANRLARWAGLDGDGSALLTLALALAGLLVAGALLRAIAIPVLGFFGDEVVAAVEERAYPGAATRAQKATFAVSMRLALFSVVRFLMVNLVALPAYLFLLFTAVGPIILFVLINAVLLGRDLGEMVAVRHGDKAQMQAWLRATRIERSLLGLAISGLFMIPVANLIAPVLGAAAMTHLFHGKRV